MKESQSIDDGRHHLLHFIAAKGALPQDLRERLVGIFHYDEKELTAAELAQACVQKSDQVRMG